ncbi:MAG TPA: hypothetical protein VH684_14510 [Xanthobacteraceae bacterium]
MLYEPTGPRRWLGQFYAMRTANLASHSGAMTTANLATYFGPSPGIPAVA